jgi:hypothetical protein
LGSVSEVFRGRGAGSWGAGGGRSEERRMGGSSIWVGIGQKDLRFGGLVCGVFDSARASFWCRSWRSVGAKVRVLGLSGGVDCPEVEGRMMVR